MTRIIVLALLMALLAPLAASAHYEGELLPDSVAVMEYQMVISMAPKDTLTRNKLGMVYLRQNKTAKARKEFNEILKIDAKDFDALDSLGLVCDKEGKNAEAVQWYEKALKVKPADAGVKKRLDAAKAKAKDRKK
ncbi:MAG: tetratricopeptide repeat protein [Nitrospirae bacterium]|nr:tetratricopeptide repeat protein [Nitrospirota bacterium]